MASKQKTKNENNIREKFSATRLPKFGINQLKNSNQSKNHKLNGEECLKYTI